MFLLCLFSSFFRRLSREVQLVQKCHESHALLFSQRNMAAWNESALVKSALVSIGCVASALLDPPRNNQFRNFIIQAKGIPASSSGHISDVKSSTLYPNIIAIEISYELVSGALLDGKYISDRDYARHMKGKEIILIPSQETIYDKDFNKCTKSIAQGIPHKMLGMRRYLDSPLSVLGRSSANVMRKLVRAKFNEEQGLAPHKVNCLNQSIKRMSKSSSLIKQ